MDKFLMICYVASIFVGPGGNTFKIGPDQIGVFVETPGWVKDTLLFKLLQQDGSVRVGEGGAEQKKLENDPKEGIGADGKVVEEVVEVPDTKVLKTRKSAAKKKE